MVVNFGIVCEVVLVILTFIIIFSILLQSAKIGISFDIVTNIMTDWKMRPIDAMQISRHRTCNELRMMDLLNFQWIGNVEGCVCNGVNVKSGSCSKKEIDNGCIGIPDKMQSSLNKWKGNFLCGSIIKSKGYFELAKSENIRCFSKHKPCGIIDTLGNYLCVPEEESCPVNRLFIRKQLDENNFNIETSNIKQDGEIFIKIFATEGFPCIVPTQKVFSLITNPLIVLDTKNIKNNKLLTSCEYSINSHANQSEYNLKTGITELDECLTVDFYRLNKLEMYKIAPSTKLRLFSGKYRGWRKICETPFFNNFFKNSSEDYKNEVIKILQILENRSSIIILIAVIILISIIGSGLVKHGFLLKSYENMQYAFYLFHLPMVFGSLILFIFGIEISSEIKNAEFLNLFFEMVSTKNCSDEQTNSELKSVARDFYELNDKYFNFKIFSILIIVLTIIVYIIPLNNKYKKNKNKNFLFPDSRNSKMA